MGLKDTLRKAASLLVEMPAEETSVSMPADSTSVSELDALLADLDGKTSAPRPARTIEEIVRSADGPNLDQIQVPPAGAAPALSSAGEVDFAQVYRQAGLPPAPYTAEQMLEMLASLPNDLPLDTKRQTVKVTFASLGKSIGATPETIVADASRKVAALAASVEGLQAQTAQAVSAAEAEIAALQAQVEEKRKEIQEAKQRLAQVTQACEAESDRLDDVLEFFSLDLPPSRYAGSPQA